MHQSSNRVFLAFWISYLRQTQQHGDRQRQRTAWRRGDHLQPLRARREILLGDGLVHTTPMDQLEPSGPHHFRGSNTVTVCDGLVSTTLPERLDPSISPTTWGQEAGLPCAMDWSPYGRWIRQSRQAHAVTVRVARSISAMNWCAQLQLRRWNYQAHAAGSCDPRQKQS